MKKTMRYFALLFMVMLLGYSISSAQKPKVFIYTDMSDNRLPGTNHMGTINDPDDISAMAGYLLFANMFDTRGIVIASTHRSEHRNTPDQTIWANKYIGDAYRADVENLNKHIGGYPTDVYFVQSSIKETAERYDPKRTYHTLDGYSTVKMLYDELVKSKETINVLAWGSLTEPAILVNYLLAHERTDLLQKIRIIAHWTNSWFRQGTKENPEHVANCREDAEACHYLKMMALNGHIEYFETGAIGEHGIVSGAPVGEVYFDQFRNSNLGTIFVEGKFVRGRVDWSDAATYLVLLGNWGVSLNDITSNGTNPPEVEQANEDAFRFWSPRVHDELLRRSNAAADNYDNYFEGPVHLLPQFKE
jgi:hypothetical protein